MSRRPSWRTAVGSRDDACPTSPSSAAPSSESDGWNVNGVLNRVRRSRISWARGLFSSAAIRNIVNPWGWELAQLARNSLTAGYRPWSGNHGLTRW